MPSPAGDTHDQLDQLVLVYRAPTNNHGGTIRQSLLAPPTLWFFRRMKKRMVACVPIVIATPATKRICIDHTKDEAIGYTGVWQ